jgi:alkanesulfonate monooxygenase SsuD/methylene tetrahydromethanopterin reductase-like flavin-dependent oxidoreductase (luciferase family)
MEAGREPDPSKLGLLLPVYVAETDEKARAEYEEHFWYFAQRLLNGVQLSPPGYTSIQSAMRMRESIGSFMLSVKDWQDVIDGGYAIVGSPETVFQRLSHHIHQLGAGYFLGIFQLGSLPHDLTMANLTLFSEEVAPRLRKEFASGPVWSEVA